LYLCVLVLYCPIILGTFILHHTTL